MITLYNDVADCTSLALHPAILKYEIENISGRFVPLNKEKGLRRNTCQNNLLQNSAQTKCVEGL